MHVFVTGSTGLVGSALVPQLIAAGHTVSGITRSDKSAEHLKSLGATPVHGSATDLDVLAAEAAKADAVIHLAFDHHLAFSGDPTGPAKACELDRAAITALCDALAASGSNKTFIYSNGTLHNDGPDESADKVPNPFMPRYLSEQLTRGYVEKGVRPIVVRLPPVVHSPSSEHDFIKVQCTIAKEKGYAVYVGDGSQLWQSTHVEDVASLIVLALKAGPAGVNMHACAELSIPTKDIAEFISKKLNVPTKSMTSQEAMGSVGIFGAVLGSGGPITTVKTREWTGWQPTHCTLFEELENYPSLQS